MDVDFSDILEKSRALRSKQEASASAFGDNLPRLERALPQIDRDSRRLAAKTAAAAPPDDTRALRLLSERGFETDKLERTLQSVALHDAFEPFHSVPDTDLASYLARRREVAIAAAIDATLRHVTTASLHAVSAAIQADWQASKRDLVSLSGLRYRAAPRAAPAPAPATPGGAFASPFRHPRPAARRTLHPRDRSPATPIYESIVRRAVHARASAASHIPIATELDDALVANLAPRGDPVNAPKSVQQLHAVFTALRYITGEAAAVPPAEGAFGGMRSAESRRHVYRGAHRFLCLQFREDKMKREIEARPVEARRGGVPGMKADVRAYLNLVFDRGVPEQLLGAPSHDGMPIWPQVYYCLRAGHVNTALEILTAALDEGCTDPSAQLYKECLQAFDESGEKRALPSRLLERLIQDYWLTAKRAEDPYHRVCYVVLARLDPAAGDKMALPDSDYSLLFYSIEDYLWLRLSVAHVDGDEKLPEALSIYQLSLRSIREEVKSFGPAHFDPQGDTPAFYALVLLLTGQFAEAIAYLDRGARAIAEATHIAFTLYYYGILRESMGKGASPSDPDEACYLVEYAELLWRYVSRFSRTDPPAAAVYVFTLRETDLRNELLKKLILETKDFDTLLGSTSTQAGHFGRPGERSIGVLEELWPLSGRDAAIGQGWLSVVEAAAEAAEEAGDSDSALKLYDVAGVRGKVVTIHVDRLSAVLTSRGSASREKVFREAQLYRSKLEARHTMASLGGADPLLEGLLPSFHLLLSAGEFFDLLWEKKFEEARVLLDKLGFLPSNDSQLMTKTQELRVGGGVWADAVCDRVPEILLGGMEALAALHASSRRGGGESRLSPAALRGAARTLVNFSGMMPNASADISARVVRLEVLMSY